MKYKKVGDRIIFGDGENHQEEQENFMMGFLLDRLRMINKMEDGILMDEINLENENDKRSIVKDKQLDDIRRFYQFQRDNPPRIVTKDKITQTHYPIFKDMKRTKLECQVELYDELKECIKEDPDFLSKLERVPEIKEEYKKMGINLDKMHYNYVPIEQTSTNDDLYQSWPLTKVRYAFTTCEKKIFIKVIDICQRYIEQTDLGKDCYMEVKERIGNGCIPVITFPIKDILGKNNNNYQWVKEGLSKLLDKKFGIPDKNWDFHESILFQDVKSDKQTGKIQIILSLTFWEAFCNLECYKIIDVNVARKFKSIYAERMYELLVGNRQSVIYELKNLKMMFCLENKYKNVRDFIRAVIDKAQAEMKELKDCPIYFEYELITGYRKKIEKIKFNTIDKYKEQKKIDLLVKLREDNYNVRLTDAVKQAIIACFPEIKLEREDVELKLKNAQRVLGVQELVDSINRIRIASISQMDKGKLKSSKAAYLLGSLEKVVKAKEELEKAKHTDQAPKKIKSQEKKIEWSDKEYVYLTLERIQTFASGAKLTAEEWIEKWGFEKIDDNVWRRKKDEQ